MVAFHAVILAAGLGTRMKSALPKVLHKIAGLSLVEHVLKAAAGAGAVSYSLVIPPEASGFAKIREFYPVRLFEQHQRLGTAHAVLQARAALGGLVGPVLVLYGDTPLVRPESVAGLVQAIERGSAMAVGGFHARDPKGYGRLLTAPDGDLLAIREEKDATPEERAVTFCNGGLMAFDGERMLSILDRIGDQNQAGEYYLTDAVEIARKLGYSVVCEVIAEDDVHGVNTRAQLAQAEALMQTRLRGGAMEAGATLVAPQTVTLSHDTKLGRDVIVEPNVFFGPGVVVEDDVTVKAFSHLEGATVGAGCVIGPFARLRPGTRLDANVRVGNFVELKAAEVGERAKINHLSYVGDATVGAGANIGAGTITCNYDGFRKHRTDIGAAAFVGSNTSLVAPVRVGEGAYIGSGSVITKDVPSDALAVSRPAQVTKQDWAARTRARHAQAPSPELHRAKPAQKQKRETSE